MPRPDRIEGYAIVSADGMIAGPDGRMPEVLQIEADQQFFHGALERAAAVVHGRNSCEGGPHAAGRLRLIVTRTVSSLAPDPSNPKAWLWNPQGAPLEDAWARLGAPAGPLAVIGGTEVYGLFLKIGYDAFHLSRAARVTLPGGRPVFPGIGPGLTPEDLLERHGLRPGPARVLDATAAVTLVSWQK
jgi:dihydrofolate reductase